jgi:hypothetical protein
MSTSQAPSVSTTRDQPGDVPLHYSVVDVLSEQLVLGEVNLHILKEDNKEGVQEKYLELNYRVELKIYHRRTQRNHHIAI